MSTGLPAHLQRTAYQVICSYLGRYEYVVVLGRQPLWFEVCVAEVAEVAEVAAELQYRRLVGGNEHWECGNLKNGRSVASSRALSFFRSSFSLFSRLLQTLSLTARAFDPIVVVLLFDPMPLHMPMLTLLNVIITA